MACNHGRVAMSVHVSIKTSHCVTSYLRAPWVVVGCGMKGCSVEGCGVERVWYEGGVVWRGCSVEGCGVQGVWLYWNVISPAKLPHSPVYVMLSMNLPLVCC